MKLQQNNIQKMLSSEEKDDLAYDDLNDGEHEVVRGIQKIKTQIGKVRKSEFSQYHNIDSKKYKKR